MVAMMKSPVCLSGPRPPRPRWRSQGRRRSTTQRSRPQRSVGRRQGGFLVSRGMRDPGSPGDLSPGVVNRGPGATCRAGWSRRGRKLPDAVAAKAIEAQPSFGQIKPGEDAWDAASGTGPETAWQPAPCTHKGTQLGRTKTLRCGTIGGRPEKGAPSPIAASSIRFSWARPEDPGKCSVWCSGNPL